MIQNISVDGFKAIWDQEKNNEKILFMDVRTPEEFKEIHIEGMKNIPLDEIQDHADFLNSFEAIYVTCRSGGRSARACEKVKKINAHIYNIEGGTLAWIEKKYPSITHKLKIPLMRQVMLVAGFLVVLGTLGSKLLHPGFVYLALFVGLGLLFSGVTGHCGMMMILGKMPWNK